MRNLNRKSVALLFVALFVFVLALYHLAQAQENRGEQVNVSSGMRDIALGRESGVDKILDARTKRIRDLLNLVISDDNARVPAIRVLGGMRATEAVNELLAITLRHVLPKHGMGSIDSLQHYANSVQKAATDALVSIGLPCRKYILMQLAVLGTFDSVEGQDAMRERYGKLMPVAARRECLVNLLERIEGRECAKFLIKAQIKQEEDEGRKANLRAALKLLGETGSEDSGQTAVEKDEPREEKENIQTPKESTAPVVNTPRSHEKEKSEWTTIVLSIAVVVLAGAVVFLLTRRKGRSGRYR